MILLLCQSDFDEWQHVETWAEVDVGVTVDTAHALQRCWVLNRKASEVALEWAEAMDEVLVVRIASYRSKEI